MVLPHVVRHLPVHYPQVLQLRENVKIVHALLIPCFLGGGDGSRELCQGLQESDQLAQAASKKRLPGSEYGTVI